jgi:hypothetical protein
MVIDPAALALVLSVKVPLAKPDAIDIDAGKVTLRLLATNVTVAAAAVAAFSVTVQVVLAPLAILDGVQLKDARANAATTFTVVCAEALYVAVSVAV